MSDVDPESEDSYLARMEGDAWAALDEARAAVVAELERQIVHYRTEAGHERRRAQMLSGRGRKWQHEAAVASYQALSGVARRLGARIVDLKAGAPL